MCCWMIQPCQSWHVPVNLGDAWSIDALPYSVHNMTLFSGRRGFENNKPLHVTHTLSYSWSICSFVGSIRGALCCPQLVISPWLAVSSFGVCNFCYPRAPKSHSWSSWILNVDWQLIGYPQFLDVATSKFLGHVQYPSKNIILCPQQAKTWQTINPPSALYGWYDLYPL